MAALEPLGDTMEVEHVLALAPCNGARVLVGQSGAELTVDACTHQVVTAYKEEMVTNHDRETE